MAGLSSLKQESVLPSEIKALKAQKKRLIKQARELGDLVTLLRGKEDSLLRQYGDFSKDRVSDLNDYYQIVQGKLLGRAKELEQWSNTLDAQDKLTAEMAEYYSSFGGIAEEQASSTAAKALETEKRVEDITSREKALKRLSDEVKQQESRIESALMDAASNKEASAKILQSVRERSNAVAERSAKLDRKEMRLHKESEALETFSEELKKKEYLLRDRADTLRCAEAEMRKKLREN